MMRLNSVTGSPPKTQNIAPNSLPGKIQKRVWIKASSEVVFRALTDSKELVHWFCDRASSNPCEGGELAACWKSGKANQKGRAIFTRVVPNTFLELLWIDDGQGSGSGKSNHILKYEIRSKSGMTEVLMFDIDDPVSDEEAYSILDQGWNSVLLELKSYCERRQRAAKTHPHQTPNPETT